MANTKLSGDIEGQIRQSNSLIDDMQGNMAQVQGMLAGTMDKLSEIAKTATWKQTCYMVSFFVFVFLAFYFIFMSKRG